jgi:hypothetical protein
MTIETVSVNAAYITRNNSNNSNNNNYYYYYNLSHLCRLFIIMYLKQTMFQNSNVAATT